MDARPLASRLEGKKISHWKIIEKRIKDKNDSSGCFSSCYIVENENGEKAFLKAFNYYYVFGAPNTNSMDLLKMMSQNFTYERDLLKYCEDSKMKRVVTAIETGEYKEEGEIFPVPYIVFEIAEGSLKTINNLLEPDLSWKLIAFHGALLGLSELHSAKIVHQDIKPSNILIFGKNYSKISDLGSATQFENDSNWNTDNHMGDMRYAPIELIYGYFSSDWNTRRFGADLFMMGGILVYMISGVNYLSLLVSNLPDSIKPHNYEGTYKEIIPYVMQSYYLVMDQIGNDIPIQIRRDLIEILQQLCHPVPEERGNPNGLKVTIPKYSLVRYISIVDRLSKEILWKKYDRK